MNAKLSTVNALRLLRQIRGGARSCATPALELAMRALGVDPLELAYRHRGINKFEDFLVSGEKHFLESELPRHLSAAPTLIEVGASVGEYTRELVRLFPRASIHALEPSRTAFERLRAAVPDGAQLYPLGAGSSTRSTQLYTYAHDLGSSHASLHGDVLTSLHGADAATAIEVNLVTLDEFCADQNIETVDFLKIDTEGHELQVLQGAKSLLASHSIRVIQFEFNSMNVVSRVFLKDFYDLLTNFDFYRLDSKKLLPLGPYDPRNEIFAFQNVVAVARERAAIL